MSSMLAEVAHVEARHLKILVRHLMLAMLQAAPEVLPHPVVLPSWLVTTLQNVLQVSYRLLTSRWAELLEGSLGGESMSGAVR